MFFKLRTRFIVSKEVESPKKENSQKQNKQLWCRKELKWKQMKKILVDRKVRVMIQCVWMRGVALESMYVVNVRDLCKKVVWWLRFYSVERTGECGVGACGFVSVHVFPWIRMTVWACMYVDSRMSVCVCVPSYVCVLSSRLYMYVLVCAAICAR